MKEGWIPRGQEAQDYEGKQTTSYAIFEKTRKIFKTARQKSLVTFAGLLAVASVGLAGCGNVEFQSPIGFKTSTSTPAPTPTPEPTLTPTLVPTPTPEPTRTKIPTPTATTRPTETPRPTPTRTPEPTPTLTPTPIPTPEPTQTPMPTPKPTPYPTPTPLPPPTPTEAPNINLEVGRDYKFTKCSTNTSTEPIGRSIHLESTGGVKGNMKAEIKVPKTPEEIKKDKKENPNNIETEKIIPEGEVINNPPGDLCFSIKIRILSGASPSCYKNIIYSFRSSNGSLVNQGTLLQNFCIGGTLQGSFDEKSFKYDSTTQPPTVTSIIIIDNPTGIPQQTRFEITEPCSFLKVAEREILDLATNLRIFPDQPQTIPANSKIRYDVNSKLRFGEKPTSFPLKCTVKLERILEE